ncbi:unnamed protein product, partial [Gulo gulo]
MGYYYIPGLLQELDICHLPDMEKLLMKYRLFKPLQCYFFSFSKKILFI